MGEASDKSKLTVAECNWILNNIFSDYVNNYLGRYGSPRLLTEAKPTDNAAKWIEDYINMINNVINDIKDENTKTLIRSKFESRFHNNKFKDIQNDITSKVEYLSESNRSDEITVGECDLILKNIFKDVIDNFSELSAEGFRRHAIPSQNASAWKNAYLEQINHALDNIKDDSQRKLIEERFNIRFQNHKFKDMEVYLQGNLKFKKDPSTPHGPG